jgi:hypothetical protein
LHAGMTEFGPENVRMVWDGTQARQRHPSTASPNAFIEQVVAGQGSQ